MNFLEAFPENFLMIPYPVNLYYIFWYLLISAVIQKGDDGSIHRTHEWRGVGVVVMMMERG